MQDFIEIKNLSFGFKTQSSYLPVVSDLNLKVSKGEVLALVGESGCGKSVTCLSLARLLASPPVKYTSGEILIDGEDVLKLKPKELRKVRGKKIAYIFQEPMVSLNPVFKIGFQIAESLHLHRDDVVYVDAEVISLLKTVGISDPERRVNVYPHEMSGGMQQRVMIAMALASKPEFLIADEPTTALDVTIQAQVLDLLRKIISDTGMGMIIITHNLGIVAEIADNVAVMYAGQIIETADTATIFESPLHPYTKALIETIPELGQKKDKLTSIKGSVISPESYTSRCRFFERCHLAIPECKTSIQKLLNKTENHQCRCSCV